MKEVDLAAAVDLVADGTTLGIGGVLSKRKPMGFLAALVAAGRRDVTAVTFLGSFDVELLAVAGTLTRFCGGYVGFEQLGFAPTFRRGVEDGTIAYAEYSEFLFIAGLRAAAAGLPFLPSKGGFGSDLVDELGIVEVADPYTGAPLLAVPAITPAVSVIHAETADRQGNVAAAGSVDFLSDFDINLARASQRVIVTAEEIVDELPGRAALHAHEVAAVVGLPGGALPTSLPGRYREDRAGIRRYLADPSLETALEAIPR